MNDLLALQGPSNLPPLLLPELKNMQSNNQLGLPWEAWIGCPRTPYKSNIETLIAMLHIATILDLRIDLQNRILLVTVPGRPLGAGWGPSGRGGGEQGGKVPGFPQALTGSRIPGQGIRLQDAQQVTTLKKKLKIFSISFAMFHTNWKDDLGVDGLRNKLCDEMFCFCLMHMQWVLFPSALLSGSFYKRSG